jgi:hypothetical protein
MSLPIYFRPREPSDLHFILDSWSKQMEDECRAARNMRTSIFAAEQRALIKDLLSKSKTLMMCNEEDPDQILGYAVVQESSTPIVHFIYLKEMFRKLGLSYKMLEAFEISKDTAFWYTQLTKIGRELRYKFPKANYNYFLAFNK